MSFIRIEKNREEYLYQILFDEKIIIQIKDVKKNALWERHLSIDDIPLFFPVSYSKILKLNNYEIKKIMADKIALGQVRIRDNQVLLSYKNKGPVTISFDKKVDIELSQGPAATAATPNLPFNASQYINALATTLLTAPLTAPAKTSAIDAGYNVPVTSSDPIPLDFQNALKRKQEVHEASCEDSFNSKRVCPSCTYFSDEVKQLNYVVADLNNYIDDLKDQIITRQFVNGESSQIAKFMSSHELSSDQSPPVADYILSQETPPFDPMDPLCFLI